MYGVNVADRVVCKSPEHEERFRRAVAAMHTDRRQSGEWLATLYILTWLSTWEATEPQISHSEGLIRWAVIPLPPAGDEFTLFKLAMSLYNGDYVVRVQEVLDLSSWPYDLAMGALQIRKFGTRVLSWLEAGTKGQVGSL